MSEKFNLKTEENVADLTTSKILKELGFDDECENCYNKENDLFHLYHNVNSIDKDYTSAPLWQQIKKWLWEKHKYFISLTEFGLEDSVTFFCHIEKIKDEAYDQTQSESPIDCEIKAIKRAVEVLHKKTAVAVTPNEIQK